MFDDDLCDEPVLALPPALLCERCQHGLCPCCSVPWCDRLLDDEDMSGCCDGDCVVDAYDFESWQQHVAAVRREFPEYHATAAQLGPPRPYTRERYAALLAGLEVKP